MVRHNNQLPNNLTQLQNLIKRDPESYKEEFLQQLAHFDTTLDIFNLNPTQYNKKLDEQAMFLAQVSQCYLDYMKLFPQKIIDILKSHNTVLHNDMRLALCKCLILLRNKNFVTPFDLLELFFVLLKCQDKHLREFLKTHIITDIKNMNIKHKDMKLNSTLQNFMFSMLRDSNAKAAKLSVDILIELYHKNIWNDNKTVNIIADVGCFSKITKVMVASLKFFLGKDKEDEKENSDSDDEIDPRDAMIANKFNKKTRKREKMVEKVKKIAKKMKKKKEKAPSFNFSALHLINNPQGFSEKLFKQMESSNDRFEVKLMTLDVISRLIGLHNLFLFNYYSFIARLILPHQREVTRILQFAAQASHELVPSEVIEPVMKAITNNFITERNSTDVMAVGLNAVREICFRCPLAISEDLLRDLVQYKSYKEKSVMMAAKSLIQLYRQTMPHLLHKKDRGRPTEASLELKPTKYGEINVTDYIPGSEVLLKKEEVKDKKDEKKKKNKKTIKDDDSDSDEWVDVASSDSEINISTDSDDSDQDNEDNGDGKDDEDTKDDNEFEEEEHENEEQINQSNTKGEIQDRKILKAKRRINKEDREQESKVAREMAMEKIFTDEDFKRIEAAQIKKHVRGVKRDRNVVEEETNESGELVQLSAIENIHKKRKHDKNARLETVLKGRDDRDKFGYKDRRKNIHCSKTNREKRKTKNYQMVKHKAKGKIKRSFKDKQIAFRNYLIKQKKMR